MFLYLTSNAWESLDGLIPYLPKPAHEMRVAFIPTAGDLYHEKPWQAKDRQKLLDLGFEVEDIDIKEYKNGVLKEKLSGADIIFVAGGNTSYLLEQSQQSGFLEITKDLVRHGTIYIGSSAGSLLAGPNIEMDTIYDDGEFGKELESYVALGFVDFVILPHANNVMYAPYLTRIVERYGSKYNLSKLNDNQAILVKDSQVEMIAL